MPRSDRAWGCQSADHPGEHSSARSRAYDGCCLLHRAHDAVMRTATAYIVVERLCYLGPRGLRIPVEKRFGGNKNAGETIAALAGLFFEKSLLQRMRIFGVAQTFNSDDLFALDAPGRLGTAFLRRAVDQDHATATLFEPAAKTSPDEAKLVAQHVQERRILVVERNVDGLSVDGEGKNLGHVC